MLYRFFADCYCFGFLTTKIKYVPDQLLGIQYLFRIKALPNDYHVFA